SVGHMLLVPVQLSATSQMPAAARHWMLEDATTSGGQAAPVPVQVSATAQMAAAGRQAGEETLKGGEGPTRCVQPQDWGAAHAARAGRRALAVGVRWSGEASAVRVQLAAGSQTPAEARQTVDEGTNVSAGQAVLVPVQLSATSQTPAAGRQRVPAWPAGCWQ